ncbi:histone deacetylase family protein [Lichenicoccus sp.]|uniref:histone deacetylase family protein n=1 Tax=Lichenicoccus sp. TaxID=2781899 RepID=UPI003D0A1478
MPVGLFTHSDCLGHETGPGHPESPDRLRAVWRALEHPDFATLRREDAPLATNAQLALAHPAAHVRRLLATRPPAPALARLDEDTLVSAGSIDAALRAAGAACAAVDAVMQGRCEAAFAAVRPPGHHAEAARAMGFCLFSSAAIAALHARTRWGLQRIAVADFDVHHGNGTQAILQHDPGLFFASSHQSPCYPGTGAASERGAANNVVNLPLPPGSGSKAFRQGWSETILPALDAFAPGLLIISAGFDAHRADPLAQLTLEVDDFRWITEALVALADRHCGGRVVSLLEGGYDLAALAASSAAHVRALMRQS